MKPDAKNQPSKISRANPAEQFRRAKSRAKSLPLLRGQLHTRYLLAAVLPPEPQGNGLAAPPPADHRSPTTPAPRGWGTMKNDFTADGWTYTTPVYVGSAEQVQAMTGCPGHVYTDQDGTVTETAEARLVMQSCRCGAKRAKFQAS
jgi:hypothetical protein